MAESPTNLGWDVLPDLSAHRGSLTERLTTAVRTAIGDGRLPHDTALPSSRTLARLSRRWSPDSLPSRSPSTSDTGGRTCAPSPAADGPRRWLSPPRRPPFSDLDYPEPGGAAELRRVLATYLNRSAAPQPSPT